MKNITLILLMIVPILLFGQETKKNTDRERNEIYFVLKSDKATMHGEYKKLAYNNSVLVRGHYKRGIKDSIWEFYNFKGEIIQKYDYTKNELIFLSADVRENKYKVVGLDSLDVKLSRAPIFLGGSSYIASELVKTMRYPADAMENNISGRVLVSFIIDKNGKSSNYQVKNPLGHGLDAEAIRVLKLVEANWLPGILNGQAVDVELEYPIQFQLTNR